MAMLLCFDGLNNRHLPVLVREDCIAKVELMLNGAYRIHVTTSYNEDTGHPDGVDQYWTTEEHLREIFGFQMLSFAAPEMDWG